MSRVLIGALSVILMGQLLVVTGCGGRPLATPASWHPTPAAARGNQGRPARLRWRVGETFIGAVAFDELDQGAVQDELRFTAQERFQVVRVQAAAATIRVAVTSWRWRRNTSELLTRSLPPPSRFDVAAGAEIVSGVDWPLPSELPLPGLDVFAAPLSAGTGWSRTDGAGAGLSYQAIAQSPPGATALDWSVLRPQFTMSGDPITVSGRAEAIVSSRYQRRGADLTLRSTREQATFDRTTRSAAGTTQERGSIQEITVFSFR